jgi:hypothetical protein
MPEHDDLERALSEAYRRPLPGDASGRDRLLQRLRAEPTPRRASGPLAWLVAPRAVWLSPLAAAAAALVLLGLGLVGGRLMTAHAPRSVATHEHAASGTIASANERIVRFELVAPGARNVALVGDFNGWDPDATPMLRSDGSWSVSVPLANGRHVYAFVVDGTHWVADPGAPLAAEEGFGFHNSVVVVGEPGAI